MEKTLGRNGTQMLRAGARSKITPPGTPMVGKACLSMLGNYSTGFTTCQPLNEK